MHAAPEDLVPGKPISLSLQGELQGLIGQIQGCKDI